VAKNSCGYLLLTLPWLVKTMHKPRVVVGLVIGNFGVNLELAIVVAPRM
jgi:hypothetical protein